MKETLLDVLMYLFEHYLDEDSLLGDDQESLRVELGKAGFDHPEINKALAWLEGLAEQQDLLIPQMDGDQPAIRVYHALELDKLDTECRGFLLFLEQLGVLDPLNRERVVDRVMALEDDEIDLDQLKWVVLMVLFNQPGQEDNLPSDWMEDLLYSAMPEALH